jgi:hypothetical protein
MIDFDYSKPTDSQMVRKAILCFSDIIKHAEADIAVLYLAKITANLENVSWQLPKLFL